MIDTSDRISFLATSASAKPVPWIRASDSQGSRGSRRSAMGGDDCTMIPFDAGKMRPYRAADLERVLRFAGECNLVPGDGAVWHPGDVVHFMSNTLRGRDLARHVVRYDEPDRRLRALAGRD